MLVQLNKCVVVCGSDLQRRNSSDRCLSSSILFKYGSSRGQLFVLNWGRVDGLLWGVLFRVVEVCVDYDCVNVFHVCLDFCVVYGVGVCVNVCVLYSKGF